MKKTIGLILLWVVGSILVGFPMILTIVGALGIFATCYFGVYHKLFGASIYAVFVWGLAVLFLSIPNVNDLNEMGWEGVVEMADNQNFGDLVSVGNLGGGDLADKLAEVDTAYSKGLISETEKTKLRQQLLTEFSEE